MRHHFASLARPTARFNHFAALLLVTVAACSTDNGSTGPNEMKIDNSEGTDGGDAGAAPGLDARAKPVLDGAANTGDVSAPGADGSAAEPLDAGASPDASEPTAPDASAPEADASTGGKRCGTRGGITCAPNEFCDFGGDASCGATDKGGLCKPITKACTKIYKPVCGCDNRSYGNECEAHAAGSSVQHEGLCTPGECESAGGKVKYSTGADIPKCPAGQDSWNLSGGIEPVICCAGKATQPDPGPGFCGGFAGFPCAVGEFCNYEPPKGQGCDGIADGTGSCEAKPQACTFDYNPVCGCNGETYSNACAAHGAGISVKAHGACP